MTSKGFPSCRSGPRPANSIHPFQNIVNTFYGIFGVLRYFFFGTEKSLIPKVRIFRWIKPARALNSVGWIELMEAQHFYIDFVRAIWTCSHLYCCQIGKPPCDSQRTKTVVQKRLKLHQGWFNYGKGKLSLSQNYVYRFSIFAAH